MAHIIEGLIREPDRTIVVVDFDGTLAAITDDPATAKPVLGATRALSVLAREVGEVAVVSGRPLSFLQPMFETAREVTLYGVYGLERYRDGQYSCDPRVEQFGDVIATAAAAAQEALPEARVEQKLAAVMTLHWRERPDLEDEAMAVAGALAAGHNLQLFPGRMSVELRVPIEVSKATTIAEMAANFDQVVIAGDDAADLDAMRSLRAAAAGGREGSVCAIAVASSEAPAGLIEEADHVVSGPGELVAVLGRTAALLMARGDLVR